MSLKSTALKSAIKSNLSALSDAAKADDDAVLMAISEAIITYLVGNTEVHVTVKTTGSASAQKGTGVGGIS